MSDSTARPHVVIIGGGFAGLHAARQLRRAAVDVTIVDRRNHHLFQPLLYQVAMAALNPSDIASPIRSIVRNYRNTEVLLGEVKSIDRTRRLVVLDSRDIPYDYLIVATGATHSYFGRSDWERDAPGLKTIEDALEIRRRVLVAYEAAERETDPAARAAWMTFVVVGAGPTGVELAGALSEIARHAMSREFRHIDPGKASVILVEAADRVLPSYPESLSTKAAAQLRELTVEVMTSQRVTELSRQGVSIGSRHVAARTVLWAAGVQASPLAKSLAVPLDGAGRVEVEPDLTIPGDPHVFIAGDLAAVKQDDGIVPGVAPAAMQGGRAAAKNVLRRIKGEATVPFHYVDKGSLATIGRAAAVADLPGGIRMSGFPAWFAWLAIHIFFLIGFRNRIFVFLQWAWAYVTYRRGSRLITGDVSDLLK